MQEVDEILIPRWLVPMVGAADDAAGDAAGDSCGKENYALAIAGEKIVAVDSLVEIRKKFSGVEIDLGNHVLLPGLINTHTHAAMTLLRGFADDLPLMQWLSERIWPTEAKFVDAEFVAVGSDLAIAEMIKSGTTCFNDMYLFPEATAARAEKAGMRACIGLPVIDFPTKWAQNVDEYIKKGLELRDEYRHSSLITTAFSPHAPHTVSDVGFEKILTYSEESDILIHMHIHESEEEITAHIKSHKNRPLTRLAKLELLSPKLVAVHMTQLEKSEMDIVAERGVNVVHCPQSNMKLASGFCKVAELKQHGVHIAIGTDGAASNNDLDMMGEMQTASLLAKGVSADARAMSAYESIYAATYGGARALGLDAVVGSLVAGKQADIIAVDLSAAATTPIYNPLSQIVYSASRNDISDVWVGGKRLLRDRSLTTIDEEEVIATSNEFAERIKNHAT